MKYRVQILSIFLLIFTLIFPGCSSQQQQKDVPVSDISTALQQQLSWVDTLRKLDDPVIENFYGFDTSKIDSLEVYVSDSGSTAEEIALCFSLTAAAKRMWKPAMESRVEKLKKQFENYMPEEMYKLENAVITSHGDYVLLVICDEFEDAGTVFDNCFA